MILLYHFQDNQLPINGEIDVIVVTRSWVMAMVMGHRMSEQHLEVRFWTAAENL